MKTEYDLKRDGVFYLPRALPVWLAEDAYRAAEVLFYCSDDALRCYQTSPERPGYAPPGSERVSGGSPDVLRRYWEIRNPDRFANQIPPFVPDFEFTFCGLFRLLEVIGTKLLEGMGAELGKPCDYFAERVRGGSHLLRVNHYPPLNLPPAAQGGETERGDRFPAHRDLGLLTLHVGGGSPGLEVETPRGWERPECPAGSLLLYGGNMLALESAGLIRPIRHRVGDLPGERISIVFFLEPRSDVVLPNGERAGDYLERIMRQIRVV